jgi:thiol-disulfide isomerase/thioredoxin
MTSRSQEHRPHARRRLSVILACGIAGLGAGLVAVYGIAGLARNVGDPACQPALQTAQRIAPLARGEVAALRMADEPQRVPELAFKDGAGTDKKLDDWRGRVVLLNLWATWCFPCRKEMPALEELQQKLGSDRFEVVSVNIDTRDPDKPRAWLKDAGISRLGYYADPTARVFQELKAVGRAVGMPTTLLVDAAGCEIASLAGPAEWASDDALKLVQAALAQ